MFAFEGGDSQRRRASRRARPVPAAGGYRDWPEHQGFVCADAASDDGPGRVSAALHGPAGRLSARRWKTGTVRHVSQSSHDDRHDAGRRGRRHHCHQAPTRHCAIDTLRITNEPKARSSTLSPVLPKHNNGSSGGFPRMTRLPRNRARRTAAPDARQGRYAWERTRAPAAQPHSHHCLKFSNSCV